jgi:mannose-6-phosphate isomerase-like protein (cupin superfamily)
MDQTAVEPTVGTLDGYVSRRAPGMTFPASGRDNQGRFDFGVAEGFPYAAGPPLHTHAAQEDSFFVVEGILTVQLGDEIFELGSGDFATAPPGVPHSFTNAHPAEKTCRVINVLTPGNGFDGYLSQLEEAAAISDHEAMERLNAEYGVTIVGPSLAARLGLTA